MSSENTQTPAPSCAPGTLEEELEKIEREQSEVVNLEERERELEELNRRARELATELRVTRANHRRRAAESALPVVQPHEPCAAAWVDMTGNDRVRACGRCKSRVYDLSGLDPSDARRLLTEHEGQLPTTVTGRVDGTVTVNRCSTKRRRVSPVAIGLLASGAAGLLIMGLAVGYALGGDEPNMAANMTAEPVELQSLVAELVKAQEQRDSAQGANDVPAPSTPERTRQELDEDDRSQRRNHRRAPCRRRGTRRYSPWSTPLFFFWDSADEDVASCG